MTTNYQKSLLNTTNEITEDSIIQGIATTPVEKREIYHFRYQVYVEEMSKHLEKVDNVNKLLYDEFDEWGILLFVKLGSELIATARINIGTIDDFPQEEATFLSLDMFQDYPIERQNHQFAFVTKIMVAPAHRSSQAFYLLIAKCYELCCDSQVQFMFGICNFHLIRLYEKMGTHRYGKNFFLPGYGLQSPLVLLINDAQHLRMVRSPLFRIARKRGVVNMKAVEWFHNKFIQHSSILNSQSVTEEKLWTVLCERLSSLPTESIAILSHLSVAEAKKFLHCCASYVLCDPGNLITTQGDVSYTYNILLSGKLKSLTFLHPVKEYSLPGQNFGANGLTEHNKNMEDIVATNSVEMLALSGTSFQKFSHSNPEIAHKVVQNIIKLRSSK